MLKSDIVKLNKLCKAVAKHKVTDEDGERVSVAFGGNCGVFAMALLNFLTMIDFPYEEWEIGFLFDNIKSLQELYKENEADLNHVVAFIDGKAFDGEGETNPSEWYGKLFKIDNIDKIVDIISNYTINSIGTPQLEKIFAKEWAKISKES